MPRGIQIRFQGLKGVFVIQHSGIARTRCSPLKVIESFSSAVEQSEELNAAVGAVGKTAEETARKEAEAAAEKVEQYKKNEDTITALEREYKQLSLTTAESIALKVEEFQLQGATIEQAVKYQQLLNDIEEKKQGIADVRPSAAAYSDFGKLYEDEAIALQAGREGHTMYAESLNMLRGFKMPHIRRWKTN